jgi:hypothetical protein
MPPRGYQDETKRLERSIDDHERALARLSSNENERLYYKTLLADRAEAKARRKAAGGREPHLRYLVNIAVSMDRDGLSAHAATGKIADEMGGSARVRHANHKTLYRKFQQAPALYRRLASAPEDDPAEAAEREICESLARWGNGSWQDLMVTHPVRK